MKTTELMRDRAAAIAKLGLSIKSEFVPFSKSRNAKEKHKSLNWRVTLQKDGRDIITTDYSAGATHCPAYKLPVREAGRRNSIMRDGLISYECEHGYLAREISGRKAIEPNALDVIHSLVMDADVLESSDFEDWASNSGYDTDSRSAETIYRACLEIALKLRNGLGEKALAELREAFQDY